MVLRILPVVVAAVGLIGPGARAEHCSTPGCEGPDINLDCVVDLSDLSVVLGNFGATGVTAADGDTDGDQDVDLSDLGLLLSAFGLDCGDPIDPNEPDLSTADLRAYRPQFGTGYAPFVRTAVDEADETSPTRGPGIRVNQPGELDPAGEDDLIEVTVTVDPPDTPLELRRTDPAVSVWTTRDRQPGSEIPFAGDRSGPLPFAGGAAQLTVWVEWTGPAGGSADLDVVRAGRNQAKDTLTLHSFQAIVMALGGEDQQPAQPIGANLGTFVVAEDLYPAGYDVQMFDEDEVSSSGAGPVYDEIVTAVRDRGVTQVALFGYSHGGGSVYHLAQRLDANRATIGVFELVYTSYADSVRNNSDIDVFQETRRPPSSQFHLNHYQHGSFSDFFLDGGPVTSSNPPPTGLDVETTPWGAGATHFEVEDFVQVRDLIFVELTSHVSR